MGDRVWVDLGDWGDMPRVREVIVNTKALVSRPVQPIIQANQWIVDDEGNVELVAVVSSPSLVGNLPSLTCNGRFFDIIREKGIGNRQEAIGNRQKKITKNNQEKVLNTLLAKRYIHYPLSTINYQLSTINYQLQ